MKKFVVNNVRLKQMWRFILLVTVTALFVPSCDGHGRLIEPPSRASAWRYGFNTPPDYNDHELYCGGLTRQWKRNSGKCGECGDAWDLPVPRPHEDGGQWGQGVIVRRYAPGAEMLIRVELTASHMGYFEFRVCPEPKAKQDCLDRYVLPIHSGSPSQPSPADLDTRFYPRNGSRIYEIKTQLPDISCGQCVLQWRYVAGNNWGTCPDGSGAIGCGEQEEFRSCSDIAIGEGMSMPIRPVRPSIRTTHRPTLPTTSTEPTQKNDTSGTLNYIPILVVFIILVFAVFLFVLWYLNRQNSPILAKYKEYIDNRMCGKKSPIVVSSKQTTFPAIISYPSLGNSLKPGNENHVPVEVPTLAPVPPPRTRRQARIKDISPDESSIA